MVRCLGKGGASLEQRAGPQGEASPAQGHQSGGGSRRPSEGVSRGCPLLCGVGMGDRRDWGEQTPGHSPAAVPLPSLLRSHTHITISCFPFFLLFAFLPSTPHPIHSIPISIPSLLPAAGFPHLPPFPSDYLALQLPEPSP